MKSSPFKKVTIAALIWALLPWGFCAAYTLHKPHHADAFWLPAIPLVFVSFIPILIPAILGFYDSDTEFSLGMVIGSSIFNLMAGLFIAYLVRGFGRKTKDEGKI
jgi:hypothetical protein